MSQTAIDIEIEKIADAFESATAHYADCRPDTIYSFRRFQHIADAVAQASSLCYSEAKQLTLANVSHDHHCATIADAGAYYADRLRDYMSERDDLADLLYRIRDEQNCAEDDDFDC